MCEKSRRDLILGFVNEDPALKEKIIRGEGCHTLDVKRNAELSEDDGFGSERVDSSEEKLSDSSFEGQEDDKGVSTPMIKDEATATTSDYGRKEVKSDEEARWIPEDNLATNSAANFDPDLNSRPIDSDRGGNDPQEKEDSHSSSETKVSEKKEQRAEASDTEIYEDEEDEWEYEWEEGEENEYEYMEHSEDEDDYTVESFAGSFSISVSK